jgi:hypothetical protein
MFEAIRKFVAEFSCGDPHFDSFSSDDVRVAEQEAGGG